MRAEARRAAAAEQARLEAIRQAEEEAALMLAQLKAAEEAVRLEAARVAAEEAARDLARRIEVQEAELAEQKRKAAERAAKHEAERLAAKEASRAEAARAAAEASARAQAERAGAEEAARLKAERHAAAEAARIDAERLVAAGAARVQAKRKAAEDARLEAERAAPAVPVPAAPVPTAPRGAPKAAADTLVMIADDSKVVRVKANRMLVNNQYKVQQAEDGLDALRQIEANMPDILITDVEMPGMTGFELTLHLRSTPQLAHIPIIMISAEESYGPKAAEAGVDVLLGKPYADDVMLGHIERFMRDGRQTG